MQAQWIVMKFGGTSVAGRPQWETIASLARQRQAEYLHRVACRLARDVCHRDRHEVGNACDKIADGMFLRPIHRQLLAWAADLHETGLGVSHSQYHLHSGYLVEHAWHHTPQSV